MIKKHIKLIISVLTVTILTAAIFVIGITNNSTADSSESYLAEKEVEEEEENDKAEEQSEKQEDSESNKDDEKVEESESVPTTTTEVSKPVENKEEVKTKEVETKKENSEAAKKPEAVTYKSKSSNFSFVIPAKWQDKYFIQDDGTTLSVYMKHKDNLSRGSGLLFIITSDLDSFNNGDFLDTISGISKHTTLNGKEYLIGGPTDFRMDSGDSLVGRYKEMIQECSSVLKTLK